MFHRGPIAGIAAAGAFVATAGYDNQLILWDAASKRAIARSCHDHLVNNCAFSPDGKLLVSASSDYSARIWNVPSMRLKAVLTGHEDDVDMAVFSPAGTRVATCALDRTIRIFDLAGHCLKILRGHTGNILSVAWTRDGTCLVSSSVDGTIREWDASSGTEIRRNDLQVRTDTLAIDADGRILAGDDKGRIALIDGGSIAYTQAHRAGIKYVTFDQTASTLITLSYDRTAAIWSVAADGTIAELSRAELPAPIWARAAAPIGRNRIAVGTFGSSFAVFDWRKNTWDMDTVAAGPGLNAVAVAGGSTYAIGDAGVLLQDGQPSSRLHSLCNFLLPVGNRLFTGGQLGQLFDARSGEILYRHHSPLNCGTSFVRDGIGHIAIGSYTGEALVFALDADGRPVPRGQYKIYDNAIKGMAATADRLFSVCASTDIAWHDTADFSLIQRIPKAHDKIANGCALAGTRGFASIGRDLKLRIWTDGQQEVYRTPHPNSVKCICANEDRTRLMTGAYTGTLAEFDLATRSWISFSRPTASGISGLAWDNANRRFLASSYDGQIHVAA